MRAIVACVLLGGCMSPAASVGPNQDVHFDQGVNGDVSCDRGTIYLPANATINGTLDGNYCVLKIEGTVNGAITVTGGLLHVIGAPVVNGELDVTNAYELVVTGSTFNGGADIEGTRSVTVTDNQFNGDVSISGSTSCTENGNEANGSIVASNCL